jgi:hypothetical protein
MKTKAFDAKFEKGGNVMKHLNMATARRPGHEQKRVNVDFPVWMVQSLDSEAKRLGVTRQSIIKLWLADKLKEVASL